MSLQSLIWNAYSLIIKTITFTELTFLKNTVPYTLIILIEYSSFPVCLIYVIIVRYQVGQNIALVVYPSQYHS